MAKEFELTPGERKALLLILFLCVIGTILTVWKTNRTSPPKNITLKVQIDGAVVNPGIYQLPEGARVEDAIQYAGGLREDADTSKLNLVARVKDGQRITVPFIKLSQFNMGQPVFPSNQSVYSQTQAKLDINTATIEELSSLPGIGPSLADKIVRYRQSVGRFNYLEELLNVPGIGEKKLERIRPYIEVR